MCAMETATVFECRLIPENAWAEHTDSEVDYDELEKDFLGNFDEFDDVSATAPSVDKDKVFRGDSGRQGQCSLSTPSSTLLKEDGLTENTVIGSSEMDNKAEHSIFHGVHITSGSCPPVDKRCSSQQVPNCSEVLKLPGTEVPSATNRRHLGDLPYAATNSPSTSSGPDEMLSSYIANDECDDINNPSWDHIRSKWHEMSHAKIDKLWKQKQDWAVLDLFADLSIVAGRPKSTVVDSPRLAKHLQSSSDSSRGGALPAREGNTTESDSNAASPHYPLGPGRSVDDILKEAIVERVQQLISLTFTLSNLRSRKSSSALKQQRRRKLPELQSGIGKLRKEIRALEEARTKHRRERDVILGEHQRLADFYSGVTRPPDEVAIVEAIERTSQAIVSNIYAFKTDV